MVRFRTVIRGVPVLTAWNGTAQRGCMARSGWESGEQTAESSNVRPGSVRRSRTQERVQCSILVSIWWENHQQQRRGVEGIKIE